MKENNAEICSIHVVDREKVDHVKNIMPDADQMDEIAEMFKLLGDPTRLQLVLALSKEELCVCDLTALTNVSTSAISHQLRILRNMKLVKHQKVGKMVYYSLDDRHIKNLISDALEHVEE